VIAFDGVRRTALTEDKVIATVLRRCPERQPSERVGAAPCLGQVPCLRGSMHRRIVVNRGLSPFD
jgi:hypothetical protein